MSQNTMVKIKNYILLISVILVVIMGILLFQEKKESNKQYELFLNHFYHELDLSISSVDTVLSLTPETKKKEEGLTEILYQIEKRVERTGLILETGNNLLNNEIRTETNYFIHRGIPGFGEDGEIDESEKEYLKTLKNELELIRKGMYSEETGQENPGLTIKQFNELIFKVTNNSELLFN
ncbi:hypothetical protein [Ornithinibacillus xuwenensis]|uniref:Uncharacterized protein n=1 Tax=Ornithinibacillus xuwenensis TaxID=3144668 RepID=A0ABU9XCT9_9BACI